MFSVAFGCPSVQDVCAYVSVCMCVCVYEFTSFVRFVRECLVFVLKMCSCHLVKFGSCYSSTVAAVILCV